MIYDRSDVNNDGGIVVVKILKDMATEIGRVLTSEREIIATTCCDRVLERNERTSTTPEYPNVFLGTRSIRTP